MTKITLTATTAIFDAARAALAPNVLIARKHNVQSNPLCAPYTGRENLRSLAILENIVVRRPSRARYGNIQPTSAPLEPKHNVTAPFTVATIGTGLAHSAGVTADDVHDNEEWPNHLHSEETEFYRDNARRGARQRKQLMAITSKAKDFTNKLSCRHRPFSDLGEVANRRSSRMRLPKSSDGKGSDPES